MKLTQKQESIITRYLLDIAVKFDAALTEDERQKGLNRLETHIHRELDKLEKSAIEDNDLYQILDECGTPEFQASKLTQEERPNLAKTPNRLWLGVCAHNAKRFGLPVKYVRIGFLVALIFPYTTPIALFLYLGAYIEKYFRADKHTEPKVNTWTFLTRTVITLAILIALKWFVYYFLYYTQWGFENVLNQSVPAMATQWKVLQNNSGGWFGTAVMFCLPLAMLSGLPMANNWNNTLHRLSQAGIAIYATFIAYGIACYIVGIIDFYIQDFGGFSLDLIPFLKK